MTQHHRRRVARLQEAMRSRGVTACVLSVGPDLAYFTGYRAMPSERLTALVVPATSEPVMVVPQLEAPRVAGDIELTAWGETENPIDLVARMVPPDSVLAIGDHMRAVFLMALLKRLELADLVPASDVVGPLRCIKDEVELSALRAAAAGVDSVLGRVPSEVQFTGRSEIEVARDLARMALEEGHETAEFTIVASGPNGASPHHEPGPRAIAPGDLVVCDFGGTVDGYYSDVTRTFAVGEIARDMADAVDVVTAANAAGRQAVTPGVACADIDAAARSVVDAAGLGDYFIHRTGHGIGLEVHEHPYLVEGNETLLEPGMTFSVEPGVYVPGRFGVRIEDIVACVPEGREDLNQADRGLLVVE